MGGVEHTTIKSKVIIKVKVARAKAVNVHEQSAFLKHTLTPVLPLQTS